MTGSSVACVSVSDSGRDSDSVSAGSEDTEAGEEESSYEIRTCGRPYALRVQADRTSLHPGGVAHLVVEVVDEEDKAFFARFRKSGVDGLLQLIA